MAESDSGNSVSSTNAQAIPAEVCLPAKATTELEQKFQRLAQEWRRETRHISSIRERSMNRAYQKIIAMGKPALPFILRDLQRTRDHWLWALNIIEDENPAAQTEIFDEAVEAWLDWGKQRGYLS